MSKREEAAKQLFMEGYNCSQSVFAAFCDLYGIDQEMALKLSASFGGGLGRMREICGAVSGMSMIAGLETGSARKMDAEGKKYNYEIVQGLAGEFQKRNGSIICRELLGLDNSSSKDTTPQKRTDAYYKARPCVQLVMDAVEILESELLKVSIAPVTTMEEIERVAELAIKIWHEHYDTIIGIDQVDYMIEKFQSKEAMMEQIQSKGYQYYQLVCPGGLSGYFAIQPEGKSIYLSKFYIDKKYRGRGYARKALAFIEQIGKEIGINQIWLTVNKRNTTSIQVYESLGFRNKKDLITDIGEGYNMDDYWMEKPIV